MKRILIFIIIIFCYVSLFAIEPKNIVATLNLAGGETDRYEIGFSSTPVDSLADQAGTVNSELIILPGSFTAMNDSIYFYWKLMTKTPLYIRIRIDEPMKRTDGIAGYPIDWAVSWGRENTDAVQIADGSIASNGKKEELLFTYTDGQDAAHSIPLHVETVSIVGKPAAHYSGTLIVTIGIN